MEKILLLHGAIGAQDHLQPLADKLTEKYKVLKFNFSGHGGKPFSGNSFSISAFAGEVLEFLDENNIDSVNIFGYSMGGYVAMHLAKNHPQRIQKIITLATKFYWDEATVEKELKMLDAEKIEQKLPAFAKVLQQRHAPNIWKELLSKTREMLTAMGKQNPLQLKDYAHIANPCLLLIGDRDKMITLDETVDVFKQLPNGQMAMLPATQHPIEQVNLIVLAFMIKNFI